MDNHYIALAVPGFFVLMGLEILIARLMKRRGLYRFVDALTDLACGMTSQVMVVFYSAALLGVYVWIYQHWRLHTFTSAAGPSASPGWLPWLIAFVGVDFCYYWWHRLSHEVNFLWAAHVVHHQSEDFNLAVALRQAVLTAFTAMPFYLPLALIGVPPVVYATTAAFSTLYQFWIHTQLVPKLRGPIDLILNLPSHHRVHHGINPRYLDKNYAATLIVWDRLFGTYIEETETPVYGLTKPFGSFDAMWAQMHYWFEMWRMAREATDWRDKLYVWVASPAWKPRNLPNPPPGEVSAGTFVKFDERPSARRVAWMVANYLVAAAATLTFMVSAAKMPTWLLVGTAAAILSTLWSFGAIIQRRAWAPPFELARVAFIATLAAAVVVTRYY